MQGGRGASGAIGAGGRREGLARPREQAFDKLVDVAGDAVLDQGVAHPLARALEFLGFDQQKMGKARTREYGNVSIAHETSIATLRIGGSSSTSARPEPVGGYRRARSRRSRSPRPAADAQKRS